MYRSPTQKSATKRAVSNTKQSPLQSSSPSTSSTLYFCHYKNAMYMGGIKSFKKDGRGILLHDSGVSIVSNYLNDLMHGHNIFFSQHCLLSAEFSKGKLGEAVYRTDGYLAHLFYNAEGQLDGKCKLLRFVNKSICYSTFRKGVMVQKEEESDFTLLNRVFDLGELDFLLGRNHARVLKYEFEKAAHIEGQKYGNKLTVGFEKGGFINGLAFTLIFRGSHGGYNPDTHRNQDEFELRVVERGYMVNSHLNGFGDKLFKNGNLYIGQFKAGVFDGNGVLKNSSKKNWVFGFFEKGNMIDLLEYNNEGEERKLEKIVEAMHERKTNWINNDVSIMQMDSFDREIEKILSLNPSSATKSLEQRKQDVLRKIQDNFLCEPNSLPSVLDTVKSDLRLFQKSGDASSSIKRFVNSFTHETQKAKVIENNQNMEEGYQMTSSRRMPNSIRKSKIFQRTISADKGLRENSALKRNTSRTPEAKKKIFTLSTAPSKARRDAASHPQGSPETPSKEENPNLREDFGAGQSSGMNSMASNQIRQKNEFKGELGKSLAAKSKIFKYLQNQGEEAAPKFIYTPIDTFKDSQKSRRPT